jgi:hypothetical protein
MKKNIITLVVIISTATASAQELMPDTSRKEFKNVIGLDITGLINQIRPYYAYDYYPNYNYMYSPYIITYKRIYNKHALRAGIGGNISNYEGVANDTINSNSNYYNLTFGIGYEHYVYLAKKWTFYYGLDLIGSYQGYEYLYEYNSNSNRKETTTTYRYGASPLLGLIFRLNKRISLATETCYDILHSQSKTSTTYTNYPYNNSTFKSTGFETQFHAPFSLIVRIQF